MPLSENQIVVQNRWWTEPGWEASDPHLRRLAEQPTRLPAPLVDQLDLKPAGIHTLRGPRQVGKSTDLKLLVRRALAEGRSERNIAFLSLDLLQDQRVAELAATVERLKSLAGGGAGGLLLLDEVTAVSGWQTAVKALWDNGLIDRDVVVCTGSSAVDLAWGAAERLPGRRGAGEDHLILPQSFALFAKALFPALPDSPRMSLGVVTSEEGKRAFQAVRPHGTRLAQALDKYLRFGGLPAAVSEAVSGRPDPSEACKRVLWDSLVREARRKGAGEPALQALLERVLLSLASKTNWSKLAHEMGVPLGGPRSSKRGTTDYRTMRDYLEFLAAGYFILIVYFWKLGSDSNAVSKDKKLYFGDPLLHQIASDFAPGTRPDRAALIENALGLALYRRYEPVARQIEGFLTPADIHVWETARGTEVDFVCGSRSSAEVLEVKYQETVDRRVVGGLKRAFPNRPVVVATKNQLELNDNHVLIPAHLLLWAMG